MTRNGPKRGNGQVALVASEQEVHTAHPKKKVSWLHTSNTHATLQPANMGLCTDPCRKTTFLLVSRPFCTNPCHLVGIQRSEGPPGYQAGGLPSDPVLQGAGVEVGHAEGEDASWSKGLIQRVAHLGLETQATNGSCESVSVAHLGVSVCDQKTQEPKVIYLCHGGEKIRKTKA